MHPALAVGGSYQAEVIVRGADGRVQLRLAGVLVSARTALRLAAGDRVEVEVDRLRPEVVLRVTRQLLP